MCDIISKQNNISYLPYIILPINEESFEEQYRVVLKNIYNLAKKLGNKIIFSLVDPSSLIWGDSDKYTWCIGAISINLVSCIARFFPVY